MSTAPLDPIVGFVDSKTFAALLGVSTRTLYTWRKKGLAVPAGWTPGARPRPRWRRSQAAEILNVKAPTAPVAQPSTAVAAAKARAAARRRGVA